MSGRINWIEGPEIVDVQSSGRSGYALGSAGSSLRLFRFAAPLRVTRRSPGREELSWP